MDEIHCWNSDRSGSQQASGAETYFQGTLLETDYSDGSAEKPSAPIYTVRAGPGRKTGADYLGTKEFQSDSFERITKEIAPRI